jgi:soluble lytic murein transglycosylase-like protein
MHQIIQIIQKQSPRKFCRGGIVLGLWLCASAIAHAQAGLIDENTRQRALAYESLFITTARQYNLDARLLWVIAYLESRFRPQAVSPKGARGLMQLMPATAVRWSVQNPHEPRQAIIGAARYVQYLEQRFAGRVDLTLAAYNAGEMTVEAYRAGRMVRVGRKLINPFGIRTDGVPPYRETRAYVSAGVALLGHLSVRNPAQAIVSASDAPLEPSLQRDVLASTPGNRKSISYTADTIAPSVPMTTFPRSISYQSR